MEAVNKGAVLENGAAFFECAANTHVPVCEGENRLALL